MIVYGDVEEIGDDLLVPFYIKGDDTNEALISSEVVEKAVEESEEDIEQAISKSVNALVCQLCLPFIHAHAVYCLVLLIS